MIIFDLGGVLLNEADYNTAQALPENIEIELVNGKPACIFNRIFDFAQHLFGPQCKRDWIIGTLTGQEIADRIFKEIDAPQYAHLFTSDKVKNSLKYGTPLVIVPEKLVPLTSLNEEGFALVKRCKAQGIRIGVLSNWDPLSFELIKLKFKELFDLYDERDIIIPAQAGFVKPEVEIYIYLADKTGIANHDAVFIDDSVLNVQGSIDAGMQGIVHRSWQETRSKLQGMGYNV